MINSKNSTIGNTTFTWFFEEVSEKILSDYFDRFFDFLEEKGIKCHYSKKVLFEELNSLFSNNPLPLKLNFRDNERNWKIVVFNTRIPHIEGEIAINEENNSLFEQVLFALIQNNLASVIMHEPQSSNSRIGQILKIFDPTRDFLLTGNKMDIYFLLKIEAISKLRINWKQNKNLSEPSLYTDFLNFFKCCITDDLEQISLPFKLKILQNFMNESDSALLACSEKKEFTKFLSGFAISFDEWSKTEI